MDTVRRSSLKELLGLEREPASAVSGPRRASPVPPTACR